MIVALSPFYQTCSFVLNKNLAENDLNLVAKIDNTKSKHAAMIHLLSHKNVLCIMSSQAEKTSEYWIAEQKCNALVQEDEIRFAGLINRMGKLVVGCFKPSINPLEDDAERQKMYMELALRVSMRKEFDYSLGQVKYTASRRQKAVMMSFPINSNVLLVSAEPTIDIDQTANKVMKIMGLN